MKKKWLYLLGYFALMGISLFSLITSLLSLFSENYELSNTWIKVEMIIFPVVFTVTLIISTFCFIVWLMRILKDISINRENK